MFVCWWWLCEAECWDGALQQWRVLCVLAGIHHCPDCERGDDVGAWPPAMLRCVLVRACARACVHAHWTTNTTLSVCVTQVWFCLTVGALGHLTSVKHLRVVATQPHAHIPWTPRRPCVARVHCDSSRTHISEWPPHTARIARWHSEQGEWALLPLPSKQQRMYRVCNACPCKPCLEWMNGQSNQIRRPAAMCDVDHMHAIQ